MPRPTPFPRARTPAPATTAAPAPRAPRRRAAPLRIVMIASEATPFSKSGGLADVASALPRALGRLGHDVTLFTPRYAGVSAGHWRHDVAAAVAGVSYDAGVFEEPLGAGARAMLVDCPPLYHRAGLYNAGGVDFDDNALRFAFLVIAALEWAAAQPTPIDVVHGHDWQAGLAPAYLRQHFGRHPALSRVPVVFTIHNLAYQGIVDKNWLPRLGLGWDLFTVDGLEFWDRISLLKSGINFSDAITTVSPTYAEEIQRPDYGAGLDGVIRARAHVLTGILNGIDVEAWGPERDPYLPVPFTARALAGKRAAKRAVLDAFGLATDDAALARPLVGIVSRLVDQKGFDLVAEVASELADLEAGFVVLGSGESRYEHMWRALAAHRPTRIGAVIGFDERLAHLVEGGADLFLMPSRYEPCGLNQMYSQRYGTVPVVRATGGLVDSVQAWDAASGSGTGFVFAEYSGRVMLETLRAALRVFEQPAEWRRLQRNGMRQDFSWERSARDYVRVYKGVIAARKGRRQRRAAGPA
ncbi:MAG: glycogen synthase GlgA [Vicinamibacterales bacterium]